jgi:hypothetical protein
MFARLFTSLVLVLCLISFTIPSAARADWQTIRTLSNRSPIALNPDRFSYRIMRLQTSLVGTNRSATSYYFNLTGHEQYAYTVNGVNKLDQRWSFQVTVGDIVQLASDAQDMGGYDGYDYLKGLVELGGTATVPCEMRIDQRSDNKNQLELSLYCESITFGGSGMAWALQIPLTGKTLQLQIDR